jgi:XRE family aerobic/anaerobic benzoate catabolism transcriptional regulator
MRELAERAGVSERFLGLLETGRANVSVTHLDDIARALGTSPATLLEEGQDATRSEGTPHRTRVALLGLRGAGKTTIGQRVALRLEVPFIELDALVVERAGLRLAEIFELQGTAYYRKLERDALEEALRGPGRALLATGGGLVTDHATYALLRRTTHTVWLRAKPEDHWNRVVAQGDGRPMANRTDAMKELRGILRARRALYERADETLDTSALGLERTVDRVVRLARKAFSAGSSEGLANL